MANRRILLSSDFFAPHTGGTEHVVEDLGLQLLAKGYSVDVLTRFLKEREQLTHRGMTIHDVDADGSPLFGNLRGDIPRARSVLAEGGYDAALLFGDPITWNLWVASPPKIPGTRVILVPGINDEGYRVWGTSPGARKRVADLLRGVDSIISITQHGADARFYREENIENVYIPNAVSPALPRAGFRQRHGLSQLPILLCVGNYYPVKNQARLIEALAHAKGDWQLVLIGHWIEAEKNFYEKVVAAAGKDRRVRILGGQSREEVGAAMHEADLLLMPSIAEIAPLTLLEAMSAKLPWIATPAVGSAKELSGGIQAKLEEFPALIARLLPNKSERTRLGDLGEQKWSDSFGWNAILPRYLALIGESEPPSIATASAAKIAVITRTKDRPSLLRRNIESVLAQRHANWTHVIVNDGGDSKEVEKVVEPFLQRYAGRLQLIHHEKSLGMEAASNSGIQKSSSDFIALLDDDDTWHPDFLLETASWIQAPHPPVEYGAVGCWTVTVREEEAADGSIKLIRQEDWNSWLTSVSLFQMSARNTLTNNSVLWRRSLYEKLGGFSEHLPVLGDWDFNMRALQQTSIGLLQKRLAYYHLRTNVQSGASGNTVLAGVKGHIELDTSMRNELLRKDLESGRFGMGAVVNISKQLDELSKSLKQLEELNRRQLSFERQMASLESNVRTLAQATQLLMKKQ